MTSLSSVLLVDASGSGQNSDLYKEIHRGGAGAVYSLIGDTNRALKIYHREVLASEGAAYLAKVRYMVTRPPSLPPIEYPNGERWPRAAWPQQGAYTPDGKQFVGFTMPLMDMSRAVLLEQVMNDKQASQSLGKPLQLIDRIKLSASLAAGTAELHQTDYAVVDMKPENIVYHPLHFEVAFLDCDGFFVPAQAGSHFVAAQVTNDYHAPEFATGQEDINQQPQAQDRFALAVIIFRLLNHGIHPFTGVPNGNAQVPNELFDRMKNGFYAYGQKAHKRISPVPTSVHESFPNEIREMFDRAFTHPKKRPTAQEWAAVMARYADLTTGLVESCAAANYMHQKFSGQPCATCLRFIQRNQMTPVTNTATPAAISAMPQFAPANTAQQAPHNPVTMSGITPASGVWKLFLWLSKFLAMVVVASIILALIFFGLNLGPALVKQLSNKPQTNFERIEPNSAKAPAGKSSSGKSTSAESGKSPTDERKNRPVPSEPPAPASANLEVAEWMNEARHCAEVHNHACVL